MLGFDRQAPSREADGEAIGFGDGEPYAPRANELGERAGDGVELATLSRDLMGIERFDPRILDAQREAASLSNPATA